MVSPELMPIPSRVRVLIADDEDKARSNLINLLRNYCAGIEVIGEASTISDTKKQTRELKPDLIFQDICMPGAAGLEFLENISAEAMPQFVFVTAHDQYALRALKAGAVDYLLKPICIEDLQQAIKKVRFNIQAKEPLISRELLQNLFQQIDQHKLEKIAVPIQNGIKLISLSDIFYIESDNSYSTLHTISGKLLVSKSIGKFEDLLKAEGFFRAHNSYLINLKRVSSLSSADGGTVTLNDGITLPIAKRRYMELKELLADYSHHL